MSAKILTFTGKMFDLLEPDPERIDLRDITHALARIGRFTGHGDRIFTDAQHSVLVCDLAPVSLKRWALLHDAEEAYVGDVSSPMKGAMRVIQTHDTQGLQGGPYASPFDVIRDRVRDAVAIRFGVPVEDVREYDDLAALLEVEANGPHSSAEHTWPVISAGTTIRPAAVASGAWPIELAEFVFTLRCQEMGIR
jgi:hypothetical protein